MVLCSSNYSSFSMIQLQPNVTGPESVAFNFLGGGPYVGVADGRILKWLGLGFGFVEFATTSPKRYIHVYQNTNRPNAHTSFI